MVWLEGSGPWVVGRSADADVSLPDDPYCSRRAFSLTATAGGAILQPLSDSSPITVNGSVVSGAVTLTPGARIDFGEQRARLLEEGHAPVADSVADHGDPTTIPLGDRTIIGRSPGPEGVALSHPAVSRRHAEIVRDWSSAVVRDLGSTNGTFVNGALIRAETRLAAGDTISFGPRVFEFDGAALHLLAFDDAPAIVVERLCKDVVNRDGSGLLRILKDVTVSVDRGEFVCIVGSSGSGKSTLMKIMAGRDAASGGRVKMNGLDLATHFAALKHDVAFVPQNDVLHEQLSLRQALDYAAQLRLPPDLDGANRRGLIETSAEAVDLHERLHMRVAHLSGGQKKRASLASETLSDPGMLFLDEVTSGLDEATDRDIMALLAQRGAQGTTIVCVTHTLANVERYCDKLIVMGKGGVPTYCGPPRGALDFFGVNRLGDLFDRLDADGPEHWRAQFDAANPPVVSDVGEVAASEAVGGAGAGGRKPSPLRQFGILVGRNARLALADQGNLITAFAQSLMIGLLVGYAYSDLGEGAQVVNSKISLLMLLGMASLWLGTNTSSTNIVGEALIFHRERDVGVSAGAFVLSKFAVSGAMATLQISIVFFLTQLIAEDVPGDIAPQYGLLVIGALAGVGLGLLISAASSTQEQANTIVPLALIPQLVLAGVLVPALPDLGVWASKIAVSAYWLTEGLTDGFITSEGEVLQPDPATGAPVALEAEPAALAALVLCLHAAFFLAAAITVSMRRFSR